MCLQALGLRALEIIVQQGRALEALGPEGSRTHKSRRMPGGRCACFASCRAGAQALLGCCLANTMRNFLPRVKQQMNCNDPSVFLYFRG